MQTRNKSHDTDNLPSNSNSNSNSNFNLTSPESAKAQASAILNSKPRVNHFNPDTDTFKTPVGPMTAAEIDRYVTHEEVTNEELQYQLGFKPHEAEYFGEGYQFTNS